MEDNLCLAELYQIRESYRKTKHEDRKFAAALKGIDLDKETEQDDAFDRVKARAEAKLRGMTEEQYELTELGVEIIEE